MTKKEEAGTASSSLPPHFKWGEVGAYDILLTWNASALGKDYAAVITLSAVGVTVRYAGTNYSLFPTEAVILSNLFSSSTYLVTAEGLKGEDVIFSSTETIKTKASGKLMRIALLNKSKLNVFVSRHAWECKSIR